MTWDLALPLDAASSTPLFLQIVEGVKAAIREGRLRPGDALPGTRALADQLGVHRNTTLAAYQELRAEGWILSRPGGGTYVEDRPPEHRLTPLGGSGSQLGFALPAPPEPIQGPYVGTTLLAETGHADPRMLPMAALARAYRRAMQAKDPTPLLREDPLGHPRLREALGRMLAVTKGLRAHPGTLLVGGGIKPLLSLVAQAVVGPGSLLAVEALGARAHWELFRHQGLRLAPLRVDDEGLDVAALEALLDREPLRALYLTPQRQYPTGAVLSPPRRKRLMELARTHRFAILENDFDAGFQYEGVPALPLASEDEEGLVIHLGAFAKLLFPNLPMAFLHGPEPLIAHLSAWRRTLEAPGDPLLQRALAELLEDGEIQRHMNRLHTVCLERRDLTARALQSALGTVLDVRPPAGGMAFWLKVRDGLDVDAWAESARRTGVSFGPGRTYTYDDHPLPYLRLGFAAHRETELEDIVKRMAAALVSPQI